MKKVKIILMSTLVVSVIGGALAFKAAKFTSTFYCGSDPNYCPQKVYNLRETIVSYYESSYCSTVTSTDCPYRVTDN